MLIDENGEMWVEFTYDAYGVPQIHVPGAPDNTLAQAVQAAIGLMLTPLLYRGYVYAAVGEMYTYYLGSRYYVPQLCRFFNADKHSDTQTGVLATNMFAYCNNNPVMHVDPTGEALEMPKIFELLNTFIELIRNLFSNGINSIGTKRKPLKLIDGVEEDTNAKSFWFEFIGNGATDINVLTSSTASITVYRKKGIITKQLVNYDASFFNYLVSEYDHTNTYLIHVQATKPINIHCLANTHKDVYDVTNGGVKWKPKENSPEPISNLYCIQKWYEPAESVGDIYTYISSSKILEFQTLLFEKSIDAFDVAIQLAVSQSDVDRLKKVISKVSSFFLNKLTIDFAEDLCEEIKIVGNYNGYSYENGIVISEYLWVTEKFDDNNSIVYSSVTKFEVASWDGEIAYGEEGYCGEWIFE